MATEVRRYLSMHTDCIRSEYSRSSVTLCARGRAPSEITEHAVPSRSHRKPSEHALPGVGDVCYSASDSIRSIHVHAASAVFRGGLGGGSCTRAVNPPRVQFRASARIWSIRARARALFRASVFFNQRSIAQRQCFRRYMRYFKNFILEHPPRVRRSTSIIGEQSGFF